MFEEIKKIDEEIAFLLQKEIKKQNETIDLIPSENHAPLAILQAMGSSLTDKYAEGYPGNRFYHGCEYHDEIETIAIERAKKLFNAEHANVQPHSGSQANMAVFFAFLKAGDTVLSMALDQGGHLTHGSPASFSGKLFNVVHYNIDKKTELIDYEEVYRLAKKHKPKLIICGTSSYSRIIDFKKFSEIAKSVKSYLLADIAHISGLIAGGVYPSPVPYCDAVTFTTHKTMRGPRGGIILCKKEHAQLIDRAIFPGIQGGPLMHMIAAKAICLKIAMTSEFKEYQKQIVKNAKTLSDFLIKEGLRICSNGTDSHLMVIDLRQNNKSGKETADLLREVNIIVNKNKIPFDPLPPTITSGIRPGTPAVTTRGMKEKEMIEIGKLLVEVIKSKNLNSIKNEIKLSVLSLCEKFPIPSSPLIK